MTENDGAKSDDVPSCLLLRSEGALLSRSPQEQLFSAPGNWSLVQSRLVWLSLRLMEGNIGKFYSQYFKHNSPDTPKRSLPWLSKKLEG